MDKSRAEPTIFFIEKISFSLKLFSGHFCGQSFIKTVRGPCMVKLKLFDLATDRGCLDVHVEEKWRLLPLLNFIHDTMV